MSPVAAAAERSAFPASSAVATVSVKGLSLRELKASTARRTPRSWA